MTARIVVPDPPPWKSKLCSVGVTGTNGKTSTTAWVAAALGTVQRPVARTTTVGSFLDDVELDVARSFQGFVEVMRRCAEAGGRFAAIELTSEALARGFCKAWPCDVGVFTNLTHDHLDAHGTPEHYLASKAQLFVNLTRGGTAVLNGCDPASLMLAEVLPEGTRLVRFGVPSRGPATGPLDVRADAVDVSWEGTRVRMITTGAFANGTRELVLPAIGDLYAENALAAFAGAVAAGVPADQAAAALACAAVPPGRFEVVTRAPYAVVDYAHTPDALGRTLAVARALCRGKLTVVFGAGGNRDTKKRAPMGAAASVADRVILTSDNPRDEDPAAIAEQIRAGIAGSAVVVVELDRAAAIAEALRGARPEDVVVIAGKGHETEQIQGSERRSLSDAEVVRQAHAAARGSG
jgi:UDP-N-acetylmuramoyl-L-alanyl-D-glutamate--2,6-diaminopimelate ligase